MGMPSVNINFFDRAVSAIKRGERGIVAMILKDSAPAEHKNPCVIYSVADIPKWASIHSKEQITFAAMGYVNTPKKILCYFVEDTEYGETLEELLKEKFDYLVVPDAEKDGTVETIADWVINSRKNSRMVKAVLPNYKADSEGIINFTTEKLVKGERIFSAAEYCARIAGIIAGTPLTISCTYAPLNELDDCTRLTKKQMDDAVDNGEFIVYNDGEKVKVGRGINSFTTTTEEKGKQFKKIKIVEAMDMITDDIRKTTEDNYLGKYANSYDNKCLIMSAIKTYFEQLELDGILSKTATNNVSTDIKEQRKYLKNEGINTDEMSDEEIKIHDTGDKIFLLGQLKILDATEEINFAINI